MNKKKFLKSGGKATLVNGDSDLQEQLEKGVYLLKQNPMTGEYYLEEFDEFTLPSKIYGNPEELVDKFLTKFENSDKNLGITLNGYKGTGKSITAKMLCIKSNLPVILLTSPFHGAGFETFMTSIAQKAIVFVDEFEKVYTQKDQQNALLTILDGVFASQKIWLFTCNQVNNLPDAMINRPGRIHYMVEYSSLDDKVIHQIIGENLKDKTNAKELMSFLKLRGIFSIDVIMSIISEMNLFGQSVKEAVKLMNVSESEALYKCEIFHDGTLIGGYHDTIDVDDLQGYSIKGYNINMNNAGKAIMDEIDELRKGRISNAAKIMDSEGVSVSKAISKAEKSIDATEDQLFLRSLCLSGNSLYLYESDPEVKMLDGAGFSVVFPEMKNVEFRFSRSNSRFSVMSL